jgi:hypothetical protein
MGFPAVETHSGHSTRSRPRVLGATGVGRAYLGLAEALTAAERIKSESLAWQEMSQEETPITMSTPSRRGLRIVGIAQ